VPGSVHPGLNAPGQPLDSDARGFFEPRFGRNFSAIRIHADEAAARSARDLGARAYTVGNSIAFAADAYAPRSTEGRALLAHELVHTVQQSGDAFAAGGSGPRISSAPASVQRRVEMRGVGRGEASGLPRLGELVGRLNNISTALIYRVDGVVLQFTENPYGTVTEFDRQMMAFIADATVLPLRLTNRHGLQGDARSGFHAPVDVDEYSTGYVDIDDLLASSDLGLQTSLVHLIRERQSTRNYDQRIGSPSLNAGTPEFDHSHARGIEAEVALLRDFFADPGLRVIDAGQRILRSMRGDTIRENERRGTTADEQGILKISWQVVLRDGRRMTPEEYRDLLAAERAAQAPAAAPPAAAPAPAAPP
jgi:hypothetical protein